MDLHEQRSRDAYDRIAADYDTTFEGKFTEKFKCLILANIDIADSDVVADIGCGNGSLLGSLKGDGPLEAYGVDISRNMVDEAKLRYPKIQFSASESDSLPFSDGQINAMIVCAAYHHFPNVGRFAEETWRVIAPGGKLYIAEMNLPFLLRTACNPFLRFSKSGDVKIYSPREIVKNFEKQGFLEIDVVVEGRVQLVMLRRADS